jgi:hypothetical protein
MKNELLNQYLSLSRKSHSLRLNEEYYVKLYKLISDIHPDHCLPELRAIYSAQRKCECLHLNGAYHIVFDQYLAQTLNQLTRITLLANNGLPGTRYVCKWLAEKSRISDRPYLSIFFATLYHVLGEQEDWPKHDLLEERKQIVILQEIFILAHEVGHYLHSSNSPLALKYNEDVKYMWDREPASIISNNYIEQYLGNTNDLNKYVEELACDTFALTITSGVSHILFSEPTIACTAVYLAHRHQRMLFGLEGLFNSLALGQLQHHRDFQKEESLMQLREFTLKVAMKELYKDLGLDEHWVQASQHMAELYDRHEDYIEIPFLGQSKELLQQAGNIFSIDEKIKSSSTRAEREENFYQYVDQATGWADMNEETLHYLNKTAEMFNLT